MEEKRHEPRFMKPKADTGPTRVLYVAGVGHQFGTSPEAVRQVFAEFGELDDLIENGVDMVPNKVRRVRGAVAGSNRRTLRGRGRACRMHALQRFCFVVFKNAADAARAMEALNHQHVQALNAKVFIQFAVEAPEKVRKHNATAHDASARVRSTRRFSDALGLAPPWENRRGCRSRSAFQARPTCRWTGWWSWRSSSTKQRTTSSGDTSPTPSAAGKIPSAGASSTTRTSSCLLLLPVA